MSAPPPDYLFAQLSLTVAVCSGSDWTPPAAAQPDPHASSGTQSILGAVSLPAKYTYQPSDSEEGSLDEDGTANGIPESIDDAEVRPTHTHALRPPPPLPAAPELAQRWQMRVQDSAGACSLRSVQGVSACTCRALERSPAAALGSPDLNPDPCITPGCLPGSHRLQPAARPVRIDPRAQGTSPPPARPSEHGRSSLDPDDPWPAGC